MRMSRRSFSALPLSVALTGLPLAAAPAASAATTDPTVEEQRLDRAAPQEILLRSGFGTAVAEFAAALSASRSLPAAEGVVGRHGGRLWRKAVDRAQGRGPAEGDLSPDDDRPLYWARLGMTRELRAWEPSFGLADTARTALLDRLERTSRGQDSVRLPAGRDIGRILLTGFDPFQLDIDVRRSNPSGALALALDGVTVETASGPARIETVVFPVRWTDFTAGTVERTLHPYFRPGPRQVDLFVTVSQGRVGRIDVERFNGAWRGGYPDNENLSVTGLVPVPYASAQPQWTSTTLPYEAVLAAGTGPFPVYDHTSVTEIPAGATDPVTSDTGPTPGSTARAGGGGNYLSNEIAYRATLLRDELGADLPGGHVHTPVLQFGDGNTDPATGTVTDPVFVANRLAITAQIRAIVIAAANASAL
jgi:pyrrolidone-carboxylate peptidase